MKYFLYSVSVSVFILALIVLVYAKQMAHGSGLLYLSAIDSSVLGMISSVVYGYIAYRME